SSVFEGEPAASRQVLHGRGSPDLAGAGGGRDTRPDRDGHAADILADQRDLPGVHTRAYLQLQRAHGFPDRDRATDLACGAVERREDTVAPRLDQLAARPAHLRDG